MRIELHDIHKSFGETEVLRGIDLTVEGGEVLALVGENGAGKSTLTRIVSGAYRPDAGRIVIDGQEVAFTGPQDAMGHGIQVIYQEFRQNIFPNLTVAENLFTLDEQAEFGRVLVSKRRMRAKARELLDLIGLDVDPATPVHRLSVAQMQMLEMAKTAGHDARLLILDEPTAALDEQESERLFEQIERLRASGVAIVYISHRLEEVFRLSQRVVVLRNGSVALERPTAELDEREVVTAMVGRTIEDFYPKETHTRDDVVLAVRGLAGPDFADVSFDVRAGEVVGIGGNRLSDMWAARPYAYLSISIPGIPNLFMLNGPNGPVGNFSLIEVAELQLSYILELVALLRSGRCRALSASVEATDRFEEERVAAAAGTVWATGCHSWYLDDRGIPMAWPWTFQRFREAMAEPDLADFDLVV